MKYLFRVKLTTIEGETIYGKINSYSPHSLITLIELPPPNPSSTSSSLFDSNISDKYDNNATFIAIKAQYVKNIQALEKDKSREKSNINEKFCNKINAPTYIPTSILGNKLIKGSKEIKKQETEFKLRKLTNNKKISNEGKKLLKSLTSIFPIDTISIDESNNIVFIDSDIKIIKPYKSSDVKVIGGNGSSHEQQKLTYIKKNVDKAWEKMEQNEKGG